MSKRDKLLVCGSHQLSEHLYPFAEALGKTLIEQTDFVLVTGGFERFENGQLPGTDFMVADSAMQAAKQRGVSPDQRIMTMLPHLDQYERDIKRFAIGNVVTVVYSSIRSRRFSMVLNADATVAIEGGAGTEEIVDLAWAADRPVLPLPWTGGTAKKTWKRYLGSIREKFRITDDEVVLLQEHPSSFVEAARLCLKVVGRRLRPRCFVAMQLDGHPVPNAFHRMRGVIEDKGYVPVRIDLEPTLGSIVGAIWDAIRGCDIVVADLTNYNANVFYELGISHALGKPTLLIVHSDRGEVPANIPFDIKVHRVVPYGDDHSLVEQLKRQLPSFRDLAAF